MGCEIEGCDGDHEARGWCAKHYARWKRTGAPLGFLGAYGLTEVERFWRLVDKRGPDECWPWKGPKLKRGYGLFSVNKGAAARLAHRYVYELVIGPISEGLTLDHTCHTRDLTCPGGTCPHRACENPAHLEPVTRKANVLAGRTIPAANAAKTHCDHGHPFDEANTRIDPRSGQRVCRACANARYRASRAAKS